MKQSNTAGVIIKNRSPDLKQEESEETPDNSAAIETAAQALIDAVHSKDTKAVADALQDAFDILDSMPHEEGEHTNSYDNQNEEAAE